MNHEQRASFWSMPVDEVLNHFNSSANGLTHAQAKTLLEKYGTNEIAKKKSRYKLEIFLSQFNALILILIAAALVSYFLGEAISTVVILAVVIVNCILGFFQEYKAEKALQELEKLVAVKTKVFRDGKEIEINAKEIVPGDIVYLDIGDIIPADLRIIKVEDFTTNESALTGESVPVTKKIDEVDKKYSVPQYLTNMAFMGTSVASGYGEGVVVSTGKNTFFGETATSLEEKPAETYFQKSITRFSNMLLKVILVMTVFVFIVNTALGKPILDSFLFAVALAVGITPEILPVIITVSLSSGALQMAKEKVITKKLVSIEDLGNIDTLCCDKTGTLTEGVLSLQDYLNTEGQKDEKLIVYGLLCNSAVGGKGKRSFGNAIDKAIWQSKKAQGVTDQFEKYTLIEKNEFDYVRRRMSVLIRNNKQSTLVAKGTPEAILKVCNAVNGEKMSKLLLTKMNTQITGYEQQGYNVIAVAEKQMNAKTTTKQDEKELNLVGFLLFLDPPKKTSKESIQKMQALGVNIKIISGDSPLVTKKVCEEVEFKVVENRIITGYDLENLEDQEFMEYSRKYNVFARVTPEQKHRIVSSLKREGHIVGFFGDGVNDVPALRAADVGISVDSGVGIAKEAANIILLKKSLNVLMDGIINGRKTFGNTIKYILNTISANFGNMFTVAISSLFLKFIPLLPSQILLNNFMSDMPLLTVSTDNVDENFLHKPRKWDIKLIARFMVYFGLISSIFDVTLILIMIFVLHTSMELFRTAWFVESALTEIVVVFAIRTKGAFFKSKPSRLLLTSSILTIIGIVLITYSQAGTELFEFVQMPVSILALIAWIVFTYFMTTEIMKRFFFKRFDKS